MVASRSPLDPLRDSASVLRRTGVLVLMVLLPLSAPIFRIGPVVAYAIGCILIVLAGVLDVPSRIPRDTASRLVRSASFQAAAVALAWALLSLVWSPVAAWRPALGLGAILLLGLAAILALPEKMRASNLYPAPVGAGALAVLAMGLGAGFWGDGSEERVRLLERTLAILVLLTFPAIAWLRSRGRDIESLVLAVGTALAAAIGPGQAPILALAVGALAYLAVQVRLRSAITVGSAVAALLVLAPLLLALSRTLPHPASWSADIALWRELLLDDPARLLTGHGLGSLRDADMPGAVAGASFLAFWYEFGLVGVAASAVVIVTVMVRVPKFFGRLSPAVAGAVAAASVLGAAGIGGGALWWPAGLATVTLLFVAVRRGQFRTRRPRALSDFMARATER